MTDKELMQEALKWHDHIKALANEYAENELYQKRNKVLDWLLDQAEKAEKYREALEFYACGNHYSDKLYDDKIILLDDGETARKVL